jgi:hypothetical protein
MSDIWLSATIWKDKIIYFKNDSLKQLEELDILGHQSFSKEMFAKKLSAELYTRLDQELRIYKWVAKCSLSSSQHIIIYHLYKYKFFM